MTDTTFRTRAAAMGIALSAEQVAQFEVYRDELIAWNQRVNLTAITDPAAIEVRHFLDALTVVQATGDLSGMRVIDVGTGAGFPGVPLKIAYPTMRLTLVDSVAKKTRFLTHLVEVLGLRDTSVVTDRAERLGQDPAFRERFDWALARAVAKLPVLAEYLLPLVGVAGQMVVQKGEGATGEVAAATEALSVLGGDPAVQQQVAIPGEAGSLTLVVCRKVAPTPARYPRRVGIPLKRPIRAG